MSDAGDQVATACPACSPERETVHEVLAGGNRATVRCTACGHVHRVAVDAEPPKRDVRAVVSQAGESLVTSVAMPESAHLEVGDEFVVDAEEGTFAVEITSIEGTDGDRHDELTADAVETLWTRDVGNVAVDVTIHPPRNADDRSRSVTMWVAGDHTFEVGEGETIDGESVDIHGIILREPRDQGGGRKLDEPGAVARARDVHRLYARSSRHVPERPW
ncbi:MAG: HVO_0476 family zinc finger protein [Halobacteriota archaeon]